METLLENLGNMLPLDVKQIRFDGNVFKLASVRLKNYSNRLFVYLDLRKKYYLVSDARFNGLKLNVVDANLEFVDWA